MQPNSIRSIVSVFVLSCGLVSCLKDNEKEVHYVRDDFEPKEITLHNEDKSLFRLEDLKQVTVGGRFHLATLAGTDFKKNPVIIKVQSQCRQSGVSGASYNEALFQNTAEIEVIRILPENLLSSVSTGQATCDFTFVLTNSMNSTYTEVIKDLPIKDFDKYSNLEIPFLNLESTVYDDVREQVIPVESDGTLKLSCEDYSESIDVKDPATLANFMLASDETQRRLTNSSQKCRMFYTNPRGPRVSPIFVLEFPIKDAIVSAKPLALGTAPQFRNPKAVQLTVTNPNAYPITVKIGEGNSMLVRPMYYRAAPMLGLLGRMHRWPLTWSSEEVSVQTAGKDLVIRLEGGQDAHIEATAQASWNCSLSANTTPLYMTRFNPHLSTLYYIGYNYDFEFNSVTLSTSKTTARKQSVEILGNALSSLSQQRYWSLPNFDDPQHAAYHKTIFHSFRAPEILAHTQEANDICTPL